MPKSQSLSEGPGREVMQRVYVVFIFICVLAMCVIARAFYIQVFDGKRLKSLALKREFKFFDINAIRGNIYSADGKILATSIPVFDVTFDADTSVVKNELFKDSVTYLAKGLAKIFPNKSYMDYYKELVKARADNKHSLQIKSNVTCEELSQLRKLPIFCQGQFKGGLVATLQQKRSYPQNDLARRTIGFIKQRDSAEFARLRAMNGNEEINDSVFVGLEGAYFPILDGKKGNELRQRLTNATWKPIFSELNYDPQDGKDIVTTINSNFQAVTENALLANLIDNKAEQGTVILMEVSTGEIKAIANLQLDKRDGKYKEYYNMAIGWAFAPGSTFKLPSMMVAMEDGVFDRIKQVYIGNGKTTYFGEEMEDDHHPSGTSGWLTPIEIFAQSSNVGVSKIIFENYKGNPWSFINGLKRMHLDESLKIDIPGEALPNIGSPDSKEWSSLSLPWKSVGYELAITPLQLLTFYNAVANDGVMVRPKFVKEIRDDGKTIKKFDVEVIDSAICSPKTIVMARQFLEAVVESGTARAIYDSTYKIAGKTGTAQVSEKGVKNKYNASFVGYFPADKPKYSCIVVINKPSGRSYYGSQVSAPLFKEIADQVYTMDLDNNSQNNSIYVNNLHAGLPIIEKDTLLNKFGLNPKGVTLANVICSQPQMVNDSIVLPRIPDLIGLGAKDAIFLLESLGLKTEIVGRGFVIDQSIKAGEPYKAGELIKLTLDFTIPTDLNTTTL